MNRTQPNKIVIKQTKGKRSNLTTTNRYNNKSSSNTLASTSNNSTNETPNTNKQPTKICNCHSRIHPLNLQMPNCLSCGFVLCMENSTNSCPFCHNPLVVNPSFQSNEEYSKANINLTRLLSYQSSSAVRTQIIDQVSDFALPGQSISQWASSEEQERQRKSQERKFRKLEKEQARESGRGKTFFSIDLKGNKAYITESIDDSASSSDEEYQNGKITGNKTQTTVDPEVGKAQAHHSRSLIKPHYENNNNTSSLLDSKEKSPSLNPFKNDRSDNNNILDGQSIELRLQYDKQFSDSLALEM